MGVLAFLTIAGVLYAVFGKYLRRDWGKREERRETS
jgi:hypothetical protein